MTFTFPHRLGSFPLFAQMADGTVTTLHGRQDCPDLKPLYIGFGEMPLVSVSSEQRRPIAKANFVGTVHHGIPTNLHTPIYNPRGGYVMFLGRISPEKRPDRAIQIAQTLGTRLEIAAKVDKADEAYFRERSHRCCLIRGLRSFARSMSATRPSSWAKRRRFCSRSIGQSRSAWS